VARFGFLLFPRPPLTAPTWAMTWRLFEPKEKENEHYFYQYIFNNPFRYIDHDGQFAVPLLI